ncbi:MAG: ribonuclease G [Gammaproteobacteria bacterium]
MKEEILVNVSSQETRVALVENGVLQEVYIERSSNRGMVGSIFKGRVSRVLPGMQAAFVDIGMERTAFLHASDIARSELEGVETPAPASISELVGEGSEVLVQVLKDPMGSKGARLTTYITIPSRYLVYMPKGDSIGISTRIDEETERERLRGIVEELANGDKGNGGYIVRTAAEGASGNALRADKLFLGKLWEHIRRKVAETPVGGLVHEDLTLPSRVLRDLLGDDVERVRVDDEQDYERMREFAGTFIPGCEPVIELYTGDRPILDLYNIEDEIARALDRKVPLKSGGYLIIDQTEAMTTIDVNTGAYVGHRNLEETIFRTNLEAAQAIARQLRLRNLGGIIILDFIDMTSEAHRRQVLQALEKNLAKDHAKNYICEVSPLGLVEMTRKRTRESLEHTLCTPCPTCEGRGSVKTPDTVCYEIFRDILRQTRQFEFQELLVLAHRDVIELLLDEESSSLAELEEFTGKPIRLQSDPLYAQDQYDVVLT